VAHDAAAEPTRVDALPSKDFGSDASPVGLTNLTDEPIVTARVEASPKAMTSDVRVAPGQGAATAIPVAENAQKDAASPATDATPSFSSQGMQSPSLLKKAGDVRVLSQEPSVVKELETRDPLPRSATKRPPLSSSDAEETPPLPIPPETPPRALEFPLRFP